MSTNDSPRVDIVKASGDKKESSYIVTLKEGVHKPTHLDWLRERLSEHSSITYDYSEFLHAYAGTFDEATLEHIRNSPDVESIHEDSIATFGDQQMFATWGLARISQGPRLSNQDPHSTDFTYVFPTHPGRGVNIYVVDSGVRTTHDEFTRLYGIRATWGWVAQGFTQTDDVGHGTGVAGVAAGALKGVAKEANIIAVKVGSGSGPSTSDVLGGLAWVASDYPTRRTAAVVNISIYNRQRIPQWDNAVQSLAQLGLHVVVCAGNDNANADNVSPAASDYVTTVGATDITDTRASFSNWGNALDVYGPGVQIVTASSTNDQTLQWKDGTSFAAPFVAGIIACWISMSGNKTPAEMIKQVRDMASQNLISGICELLTVLFLYSNLVELTA
ncbi:hypothetical protein CERSUDRAFT_163585 [Gelatoporia subvermispora B]|uniref:Peptidase S8/S53 domain-containing protein n=1 Tax=Ceriporiopsis subvermispora (strain B) TaxID=914234 RepID=M2QYJ9_CERS8|nr:hypothetical protein CERSUDRAFT_163585 [Gelatoporia subvermispora B]